MTQLIAEIVAHKHSKIEHSENALSTLRTRVFEKITHDWNEQYSLSPAGRSLHRMRSEIEPQIKALEEEKEALSDQVFSLVDKKRELLSPENENK